MAHLLRRYGEQSGSIDIDVCPVPDIDVVRQAQPTAVVFLSLDQLQSEQPLIDSLASLETAVVVCAAVADEARARELGADDCLLHPVTYEHFLKVISAASLPKSH